MNYYLLTSLVFGINKSAIIIYLILLNTISSFNSIHAKKKQLPLSASSGNDTTSRVTKHIVIVTIETPPFMMKRLNNFQSQEVDRQVAETNRTNSNSTIEWYGYCMDFFQELTKHLPYDVTYEIYQVPDNKYGTKYKYTSINKNSDKKQPIVVEKWNGIIGELYQGKADLALAPMAVMAERELVIDFTVPFYDLVGIQILLKKPEVPQDWFKFLTVLDNEVWFSITVAYFITSFVMFLFDRLSPYSHKNMSRIERIKQNRKLENAKVTERNNKEINSITGDLRNNNYNFNDDADSKGAILSKGHDLFIGSLGFQMREVRRRSSALIRDGFENFFNKNSRKESVFVNLNETRAVRSSTIPTKSDQWRRKQSTSIGDYFKGIDFGRNLSGNTWEVDDTEVHSEIDNGKPDFGLRDSLWFCITSLTPQGGGEAPQNLSGRVVAGAWWLFCFIIIASYTANLAAFLTVSRLDIPIESLDDLAKQYRIKYAPIDGTAEQTYFERMAYIEEIFYNIWKEMSLNDSLSEEERSKFAVWDYPISDKYTKIWAQIQQVGMPIGVEAGIKRVKDSNLDDGFALLADANMVKHAVMTDCIFKAVGDEFSRKPIALAVRKGIDQFRDDLSYAILQLINQRFMEILREKWWTNNPDRVICDNNDESEGISIENIGGVFIIIFAGVVLSFFVWALERFVYKTKMSVSKDLIQKL